MYAGNARNDWNSPKVYYIRFESFDRQPDIFSHTPHPDFLFDIEVDNRYAGVGKIRIGTKITTKSKEVSSWTHNGIEKYVPNAATMGLDCNGDSPHVFHQKIESSHSYMYTSDSSFYEGGGHIKDLGTKAMLKIAMYENITGYPENPYDEKPHFRNDSRDIVKFNVALNNRDNELQCNKMFADWSAIINGVNSTPRYQNTNIPANIRAHRMTYIFQNSTDRDDREKMIFNLYDASPSYDQDDTKLKADGDPNCSIDSTQWMCDTGCCEVRKDERDDEGYEGLTDCLLIDEYRQSVDGGCENCFGEEAANAVDHDSPYRTLLNNACNNDLQDCIGYTRKLSEENETKILEYKFLKESEKTKIHVHHNNNKYDIDSFLDTRVPDMDINFRKQDGNTASYLKFPELGQYKCRKFDNENCEDDSECICNRCTSGKCSCPNDFRYRDLTVNNPKKLKQPELCIFFEHVDNTNRYNTYRNVKHIHKKAIGKVQYPNL